MKTIANLATYPPRRAALEQVVRRLAPQLDRLNLVLNQYDAPIPELADIANLEQILPHEDTKDAGKFYPDVGDADWVFYVDDDIVYPDNFVEYTLANVTALPKGRWLAGYHGSMYRRPRPSIHPRRLLRWLRYRPDLIFKYRQVYRFWSALNEARVVDQIGSGCAVISGSDAPPYDYMRDSQKFVDVRLAKWCFERETTPVCLPRRDGFLGRISYEESIWDSFTRTNPPHVVNEIWEFAMQREHVGLAVGKRVR